MNLKILLSSVSAAVLVSKSAMAFDLGDLDGYVSLFGGHSDVSTIEATWNYNYFTGADFNYNSDTELKKGFITGLRIGAYITEDIRTDLELSYQHHNADYNTIIDPVTGNTFNSPYNVLGEIKSYSILANVWYDFNNSTPLTPYIGGGLGASLVDSDIKYTEFNMLTVLDSNAWAFTYQLGGGFKYDINEERNLALEIGYLYRNTGDIGSTPNPFDVDTGFFDFGRFDHESHNMNVGIVWRFNE